MSKKIFIMVLSGAYNLGDELILRSEIDFLKNKFPESQFTIATYDENSFLGSRENCRFISFFPNNFHKHFFKNIGYFLQNIYEIFRSDMIIIGGGGIFFDNEPLVSFKKNLLEWKIRLFWARFFRKKIIFFGISLEVKNPENQQKLEKIFRKSDKIFPRDERSTKLLQKFSLPAETLYDSVFLQEFSVRNFPKKPKKIGISLRGGFWNEQQKLEFKKFINFLETEKFEIIFLSHSFFGGISHNDIDFVKSLFSEKYTITKTMTETLEQYKNIDMMISMRLHSIILSAQHGIPVLTIPYGPKTEEIIKILNIQSSAIDGEKINFDNLHEKFQFLYNNYTKSQEEISAYYREIHKKFLQKIEKTAIIEK